MKTITCHKNLMKYLKINYLDKDKKGQPYVDTVESLQTIKNILDKHTQVKWLGARTPYGGRFFYGFTEYDFPSDVKKYINKKYKDVIKQNSNREEEVLQSK